MAEARGFWRKVGAIPGAAWRGLPHQLRCRKRGAQVETFKRPKGIPCPQVPLKGGRGSKKSAQAEDTLRHLPPKRSKPPPNPLGDGADLGLIQSRRQVADPIRVPPIAGEHLGLQPYDWHSLHVCGEVGSEAVGGVPRLSVEVVELSLFYR